MDLQCRCHRLHQPKSAEHRSRIAAGEVLTPSFIDTVLDTVFAPCAIDRGGAEGERDELERQLANLTAAIKTGGDIPVIVDELKRTNGGSVGARLRLEPREQHDCEQLRAALEQRVDEWRQILRAHPAQARQVLHHVIGPIMLWLGDAADLETAAGYDPNDRRGHDALTSEDLRWFADTRPAGILAGLPVVQMWRPQRDSDPSESSRVVS